MTGTSLLTKHPVLCLGLCLPFFLAQECLWRPTVRNPLKQQMHQAPLGFITVCGRVSMLKLLVSLGILFPTAYDPSPKGYSSR